MPKLNKQANQRQKAIYTQHGMSKHPLYTTWSGIRQKCNNWEADGYEWLGELGIRMCDRWSNFENFVLDVGDRPSPKHILSRKDINKDFAPDNCEWTIKNKNIRRNSFVARSYYPDFLEGWETGAFFDAYVRRAFCKRNNLPRSTFNVYRDKFLAERGYTWETYQQQFPCT